MKVYGFVLSPLNVYGFVLSPLEVSTLKRGEGVLQTGKRLPGPNINVDIPQVRVKSQHTKISSNSYFVCGHRKKQHTSPKNVRPTATL
eukprot:11158377-Prorocentrum_lima.AAC.1